MPLLYHYQQVATDYKNTVMSRKQTLCVPKSEITVQVDGQMPHTFPPTSNHMQRYAVCNDILLCGWCIVVPTSLQKVTSQKIHHGHQGIQKCQSRANSSVWWPRMSEQITKMTKSSQECTKQSTVNRESMIPSSLPDYPWQIISTDLFQHKGTTYLL